MDAALNGVSAFPPVSPRLLLLLPRHLSSQPRPPDGRTGIHAGNESRKLPATCSSLSCSSYVARTDHCQADSDNHQSSHSSGSDNERTPDSDASARWCCSQRVPAKGAREAAAAARETETDHSVASVLVSDACANTDFTACIVAVVVIGLYGLAVSYLPSRSLRHLCRIATVAMPVDHWSTSGSQVRRTAAM